MNVFEMWYQNLEGYSFIGLECMVSVMEVSESDKQKKEVNYKVFLIMSEWTGRGVRGLEEYGLY